MFRPRFLVFVGPMFSGKTEETQAQARKNRIANRTVIFFRHDRASRNDVDRVVSHAETVLDGVTPHLIADGEEQQIYEIGKGYDVIIVDEGHFLPMSVVEVLFRLYREGHVVVYSGLDTDFLGRSFETSQVVMAIPEAEVKKLTATCIQCGDPEATRSLKLIDGQPAPASSSRIQTGGEELYCAVCIDCHERAYQPAR